MAHIFKFRGPKIQKEEAGNALAWEPREGVQITASEAKLRELGVDPIVFRDMLQALSGLTIETSEENKESLKASSLEELCAMANRGLPIDWKNNPGLYGGVAEEVFRRASQKK